MAGRGAPVATVRQLTSPTSGDLADALCARWKRVEVSLSGFNSCWGGAVTPPTSFVVVDRRRNAARRLRAAAVCCVTSLTAAVAVTIDNCIITSLYFITRSIISCIFVLPVKKLRYLTAMKWMHSRPMLYECMVVFFLYNTFVALLIYILFKTF